MGNDIHHSARIGAGVKLGNFNRIGPNVVIEGFKGHSHSITIGDCNIIHENTRIFCDELKVGDYNVFHNSMLVHGEQYMRIGHNGWFGQNTILDSTGGLVIGNGVRVGMYSQIWTHAASGELIEGCNLFVKRSTFIEDEVWLVGSCIVGSGLHLGRRTICLIGSNVTKDTEPGKVYAGVPAKVKEGLNYYEPISDKRKLALLLDWLREFAQDGIETVTRGEDWVAIQRGEDALFFHTGALDMNQTQYLDTSYFSVTTKQYTKRLTPLEREVMGFLYGNKARFIPA